MARPRLSLQVEGGRDGDGHLLHRSQREERMEAGDILPKSETMSSFGMRVVMSACLDPLCGDLNNIDHGTVLREVAKNICFDCVIDDLSSVDSRKG